MERDSEKLRRIHDTIFNYSLQLHKKTEKDKRKIEDILLHIDWLSNDYFRASLDKEARKTYFVDYRDELSSRRKEISELA